MRRPGRTALRIALLGTIVLLLTEAAFRVAGNHYRARFWSASSLPPESKQVTILAIGESTTGGLWLPIEDSYPKQLERLLREHYRSERIRVLMPPHHGQNTSQMLHRFDDYLRASRPALVLLMAGVNNRWSLAESNLGAFMPAGNWRTYAFRFRRWADDVKVFRLARYLFDRSGQAFQNFRSDLEGRPRYTPWPPDNDPLVRHIGEESFKRLWRSDVGQMIERSREAGAQVILMTYPNYETPSISEFRTMAQTWSIPLVENHLTFASLVREGRAGEFFFEDHRHPNARGYALLANNVLQAIVRSGALDHEFPDGPEAAAE